MAALPQPPGHTTVGERWENKNIDETCQTNTKSYVGTSKPEKTHKNVSFLPFFVLLEGNS